MYHFKFSSFQVCVYTSSNYNLIEIVELQLYIHVILVLTSSTILCILSFKFKKLTLKDCTTTYTRPTIYNIMNFSSFTLNIFKLKSIKKFKFKQLSLVKMQSYK